MDDSHFTLDFFSGSVTSKMSDRGAMTLMLDPEARIVCESLIEAYSLRAAPTFNTNLGHVSHPMSKSFRAFSDIMFFLRGKQLFFLVNGRV
jgi:hypothetical protein